MRRLLTLAALACSAFAIVPASHALPINGTIVVAGTGGGPFFEPHTPPDIINGIVGFQVEFETDWKIGDPGGPLDGREARFRRAWLRLPDGTRILTHRHGGVWSSADGDIRTAAGARFHHMGDHFWVSALGYDWGGGDGDIGYEGVSYLWDFSRLFIRSTTPAHVTVPDASSTAALAGLAVMGVIVLRRRIRISEPRV